MQRREAVELVQHDLRHRITLQFDDDPHALAVGFVADVGYALELLLADEVRNALDHQRLVHLKGDFRNYQRFTILAEFFNGHLPTHNN